MDSAYYAWMDYLTRSNPAERAELVLTRVDRTPDGIVRSTMRGLALSVRFDERIAMIDDALEYGRWSF